MAIIINKDNLGEDFVPETQLIPARSNPAVLVYYAELGKHAPIFKGKPAVYDSGKRVGQKKDPETIIHLKFEFPLCDYDIAPLTLSTSVPLKDGSFINKLPVSDALASGRISLSNAMKSAFMKYLTAMNEAAGVDYGGLHEHIGNKFLIKVTHNKVTKGESTVTYCNMKPGGITGCVVEHPITGEKETVEVPDPIGKYGPIFEWDNPTAESWAALPDNLKDCCKKAVNYEGSKLHIMLSGMPEENSDAIGGDAEENVPPTGPPAEPQDDDLPV